MFNIVLIEPEIPPNTGNIGRLCLATGSTLHLVGPLGFSLDDKSLRRAGLDYWPELNVQRWDDFESLRVDFEEKSPAASFYFLTTKTEQAYWLAEFAEGDCLVFGSETRGLPESLLQKNKSQCLTIPQTAGRSLNLATSVGIVLYEGVRQSESGS
ncbi:MAG: tRNA (cytidine(34)-2'-O)-methyltransferase [Verrucomicrobiales bacterium]